MSAGCYYAKCKCGCGSVVFASTDYRDDDPQRPSYADALRRSNAKECAKLMRDGFVVEHADDMETVRPLFRLCQNRRSTGATP